MSAETHIKNTLRKAERLHSKKLIDALFAQGQHTKHSGIRCVYLFTHDKLESPVQVLFSVPKRKFKKAVTRNLLKRRMREAYRLNKSELKEAAQKLENNLLIAFLYSADAVEDYKTVELSIKKILQRIIAKQA